VLSFQERLTSHGSIGGSPAYSTHAGGHTGRNGPNLGGHNGGHGGTHGGVTTPSMHHQSLQSDFQPPYFPPPFHHSTQSPPQQQVRPKQSFGTGPAAAVTPDVFKFQNHGLEYLSADPYGQPLSSLHHAPLHHYNQLAGLRPTQEQLGGLHRAHRETDLQGHVVS
jgi:transcription factor AP-2, invertebrate